MQRWFWVPAAFLVALALTLTPGASSLAAGDADIILLYASFDPLLDGEPSIPPGLAADPASPLALLQLQAPITAATAAELQAAGVTFYSAVPTHAYVVSLAAADPAAVAAHPAVRWLGALHPAYKLSDTAVGGESLVETFPDADPDAVAAALLAAGATILDRDDGAHTFRIDAPAATLTAVAALDAVRWVQGYVPLAEFNDDARWVVQGGVYDTTPLYARGLTGAGQVGAVADSGLAAYAYTSPGPLHNPIPSCFLADDGAGGAGGPFLAPGPNHRKVIDYAIPTGSGGDRIDSTGHGTHVVGSLLGDQAPWNAQSPADGQAYDARVYFQDIGRGVGFDENLVGEMLPPSDYGVLFGEAYDPNGDGVYQPAVEPRTHSNSWGSTLPIYSSETAQTDAFMWSHPDFLILFAAGNQGPGANTIGYPATAKNIVTVGGTENGLADPDSMGYFSSHGPAPLGRLKPTVSAPGDRITSAANANPCGTAEKTGTSMATPIVHGVALQMRQYLTDGYYPSGRPAAADSRHPSAALLKGLLMSSGRAIGGAHSDNAAGGAWPANGQGWGRVTADDVLYFDGDARGLWLQDVYALDGSAGFDAPGQAQTFTITVGDSAPFSPQPLRVTLTWTDYPGEAIAGGALVNDLHLTVTGPDGAVHRGNEAASNDFNGLADLPPLAPDTINPWEVVFLADPIPGTYTISVDAAALGSLALDPARKQGFALVATGDIVDGQGRVSLEFPAYEVNPTAPARIRLADAHLNADPATVETAVAHVHSVSDTTGYNVQLVETAADSGVFAGQVTLTRAAPDAGALLVADGDAVTVTYDDADNGRGAAATAAAVARVVAQPLNFSNPASLTDPGAEDDDGSFTISWSPVERPAGVVHYTVQATTAYSQLLLDDAEAGLAANWSTGPLLNPWLDALLYPQSGLQSFWSGRGDAGVAIDNHLTLNQAVALPAGLVSAQLSFYSRYYNDFNDTGDVQLSTDSGATWTTLRRLYADPRVVPATTRLQYHQFDLSDYIGQSVRVRFNYDNGVVSYPGDSPGWWIDDVVISGGAWQDVAMSTGTTADITVHAVGLYHLRVRADYADGSVSGWSNVVDIDVTAVPPPPPPPPPTGGGKATGGVWLATVDGDKVNVTLNARIKNGAPDGHVKIRDKGAGVTIDVHTLTAVGAVNGDCGGIVAGPDALEIHGDGAIDGVAASFRVCIFDAGNGNSGGEDRVNITCLSGCAYSSEARVDDDAVDGGNLKIHEAAQGGSGGAGSSGGGPSGSSAAVLALEPVLLGEATAGALQTIQVVAYDDAGEPLAGADVIVTAVHSSGATESYPVQTGLDGLALLTVTIPLGDVTYLAGQAALGANTVHVTGLFAP